MAPTSETEVEAELFGADYGDLDVVFGVGCEDELGFRD